MELYCSSSLLLPNSLSHKTAHAKWQFFMQCVLGCRHFQLLRNWRGTDVYNSIISHWKNNLSTIITLSIELQGNVSAKNNPYSFSFNTFLYSVIVSISKDIWHGHNSIQVVVCYYYYLCKNIDTGLAKKNTMELHNLKLLPSWTHIHIGTPVTGLSCCHFPTRWISIRT